MLKALRLTYYYLFIGLCALASLPIFMLRPFRGENTGIFFRIFAKVTLRPMGLKYKISGQENLQKARPAVIVCNHQHNLDALVASLALQDRVVFLGKKELAYIPFFGLAFLFGGNVFVDRSNKKKAMKSMQKVRKKLQKEKLCVTIFAEGTRNPTDKLLPFKKGAFHLALQTGLPIVPMAVGRYPKKIDLNKLKSGEIEVCFLEPVQTEGLDKKKAGELADKVYDLLESQLQKM